ncbi:MAG: glycosyltransferase family 1 protein [Actinomycetes bacterium]
MTTPTRIGANLLWLVPGVVGGSEEYTVRLLLSLERLESVDLEVVLFVNRSLAATHPDLLAAHPTVIGPLSGSSKLLRVSAESTWLDHSARSEGIDLMHHLGGTMPPRRSRPGMLTIHDLQPMANPEHFSFVKRGYLGAAVPGSVRHAEVVVTLSQFVRRDVVDRLDIADEQILIVPPGIDPPYVVDERMISHTRRRHGLGQRPIFLYPAITYPHKNHVTLVRAFSRLARANPEPLLVLTGGEAQAEGELRGEIERLGLGRRVIRTGRIPAGELDAMLATATALTFPSRYEGFGLPVLEAMNRGVPVIASSVTALPEVIGDSGLLIDPDDLEGWSDAMALLLADPTRAQQLVIRGHDRAARFSWKASANALVTAYRHGIASIAEHRSST